MAMTECTPGANPVSNSPPPVSSISDADETSATQCRRLTVGAGSGSSRSFHQTCASRSPPFLRLQGRWLERAGFVIGARVRVWVSEGRLVVETVETEEREDGYRVHDVAVG